MGEPDGDHRAPALWALKAVEVAGVSLGRQEWLCHPRSPLAVPPTLPRIVIGSSEDEHERVCGEGALGPLQVVPWTQSVRYQLA